VMPVGGEEQQLTVIDKDETGDTRARKVMSVRELWPKLGDGRLGKAAYRGG
jgi:hypothetical protein